MIFIPKFEDLTGRRFTNWSVVSQAPNHITPSGNSFTAWNCKCDCGTERVVLGNALKSGRSTSCGCIHKLIQADVARANFSTHNETKTRLYQIWAGMRKRCNNPNASNYPNYGGRGISVCNEWNDYIVFRDWALANGYDDSKSIDRIDVNSGYSADNCRWVGSVAQANNRRNTKYYMVDGISKSLAEWAREFDIPYKTLWKKVKAGNQLKDIIGA